MASGDATDLATLAARRARRDPTQATWLAEALAEINAGQQQVLDSDIPWSFMEVEGEFTLSVGTDVYTYATIATALGVSAIRDVLHLVDDTSGGMPLESGDWANLERLAFGTQYDTLRARPHAWATWGRGDAGEARLRVWPRPDRAYALRAKARLAVPALTGAEFPLIPIGHARAVLVSYAAARLWEGQTGGEALAMARKFDDDHERALAKLRDAYGSAQEPNLRLMEESYGWSWPGGATQGVG